MTYKNIIIPGGGIYGIQLVGILKNLKKYNILKDIKSYLGTSAGSIICFLLIIGYTIDEIYIFLDKFNFNLITNIKSKKNIFDKLNNNYGLNNTNNFKIIFNKFLINKNIDKNITFKDLYELIPIELTINIACINTLEILFCNYKNTPDFKVVDIITISCSIPILFEPTLLNDKYYVDGGFYNSCPIIYYKEQLDKTLIIRYKSNNIKIYSIYDYLYYLIYCKIYYLDDFKSKNTIFWYNILNITPIDFNINNTQKKALFKEGEQIALTFIKNNFYYEYYKINNIN